MTISELINVLSNYNSSLEVMIEGYEGGLEKVNIIRKIKINWVFSETENWDKWIEEQDGYFGPYEEDDTGRDVILIKRIT